jgi:hypothetical protein
VRFSSNEIKIYVVCIFSSTRIGIQVGEEDGYEPKVDQQENEEQSVLEEEKSMDSVPDIIITEPSSPDTTTGELLWCSLPQLVFSNVSV